MKKIITAIIVTTIVFTSYSQKNKMVGMSLPDSRIELLLQSPMSSIDSWKTLEGKWLFLEFWATWCAPCISKMPKLNKLENEMKGENIQFISISPEKEAIVKRFLKRKTIAGWIGVDEDQSFIKGLGIKHYPTTILVNPKGIVHAYLDASTLDKITLMKIMNETAQKSKTLHEIAKKRVVSNKITSSKNLKISNKNSTLKRTLVVEDTAIKKVKKEKKTEGSIYKVVIKKAETEGGFKYVNKKGGKLVSSRITLLELLSLAYNVPKPLIFGDEYELNTAYNVEVVLPKNNVIVFEEMLKAALQRKLRLAIEQEKKEVASYELRAPHGVSKELYASLNKRGKASADKGILAATSFSLKFLVRNIEDVLKATVIDRTGLTEKYDYNLYWNADQPKTIMKSLSDQLGLTLIKKSSFKETLLVKSAESK